MLNSARNYQATLKRLRVANIQDKFNSYDQLNEKKNKIKEEVKTRKRTDKCRRLPSLYSYQFRSTYGKFVNLAMLYCDSHSETQSAYVKHHIRKENIIKLTLNATIFQNLLFICVDVSKELKAFLTPAHIQKLHSRGA